MMILNVFLEECGFFELCCARVLAQAPSPGRLLVGLVFLSGVLSALFLNDTVCLMLTPPVLTIVRRAGLPATPFLIALAMSANVGSVMTIIGNPQNMLIGVYSGFSFGGFALRMIPVGLLSLAALAAVLLRSYGSKLLTPQVEDAALAHIWAGAADEPAPNRRLMEKTLWVLATVLAAFVVIGELPVMAMAGAVGLLIWSRRPPARILQRVNWVLLLFFAGLFVVVHGLEKSGLVSRVSSALAPCGSSTPP
jgi:Na+/H+ antiporter NhaD/arsenite permease-like protein